MQKHILKQILLDQKDEIRRIFEEKIIHREIEPSSLSEDEQYEEIKKGKTQLEDMLNHTVSSFAYPYGQIEDFTLRTVYLVRDAGFSCACSLIDGVVTSDISCFQLYCKAMLNWDGEEFDFKNIPNNFQFLIGGEIANEVKLEHSERPVFFLNRFIGDNELRYYFRVSEMAILPYESILTSAALLLCMTFRKAVFVPLLPFFLEALGRNYPYFYSDWKHLGTLISTLDKKNAEQVGYSLYEKSLGYDSASIQEYLSTIIEKM